MKKVAFHTLGCKVNTYESDAMEQQLRQRGYEIVPFEAGADVYVINTCSVTNMADRKSRQMLHRARKMNPEALIVAAGCYVQAVSPEALKEAGVDLAVGNEKKGSLADILDRCFADKNTSQEETVTDIARLHPYKEMELETVTDHTRAFIKVQDGCNQFCSYCIIPYTRGRVRSRRPEHVTEEIRRLSGQGVKEFVLTGIHLSSYGTDFTGEGISLLTLIRLVHELPGAERIRLGSLEPRIITPEWIEAIQGLPKICRHFHLSLQSGCDRTLERMNRRYTSGEYLEKCCMIREAFPESAITTDVIVGFPGETEEEFSCTKAFLDKIGFYEMHIFKYSPRKGTRAAKMPEQVPEQVKTVRSNELISLEREQSRRFRESFVGRRVSVLLETREVLDGAAYWVGHTREYVRAAVPEGPAMGANQVVEGVPSGFLTEEILLMEDEN